MAVSPTEVDPELAALQDRLGQSEESYSVQMEGLGGGKTLVPVTTDDLTIDLQVVLDAQVFKDWVTAVDQDPLLFIERVQVQSVDMFGPRLGFVKFKSKALVNVGGTEGIVEVPNDYVYYLRDSCTYLYVCVQSKARTAKRLSSL